MLIHGAHPVLVSTQCPAGSLMRCKASLLGFLNARSGPRSTGNTCSHMKADRTQCMQDPLQS